MSVGHICNMALGGLENICTEWVFTCFFTIKQTTSTSSLVCLKFIFIIRFYFTNCIILIWWCCQLCENVRWQNFVALYLSVEFALCYISGSTIWRCLINFLENCCTHDLYKNVFLESGKNKISPTVWNSVDGIYFPFNSNRSLVFISCIAMFWYIISDCW